MFLKKETGDFITRTWTVKRVNMSKQILRIKNDVSVNYNFALFGQNITHQI